jgi:hypothetical protein
MFATALLMLLVLGQAAMAQTSKGFIVGNAADPNGAGIAGAAVKITNKETGVTRETVTQSDGSFRLDAVDPGTYTVEVSQTGFKTSRREEVVVAASQTVDAQFQLEIGNPTEEVTVTAQSDVVLQTQDGARVNTLNRREITELPVAGLNPVNLVFTLPGVVDPGNLSSGFVQGTEFSVNGLRPRANNQLIDGLDNNDNLIQGQSYQPTVRDGYDEVTILTSNYSAEYGRAGGAVANVITRSGTNEFHGSAYDILTNSVFSALTPGQKRRGLTKVPVEIENTLGFSFGGPLVKNKLFFFGTFQADLFRSTAEATAVVPTAAGFAQLRALFPAGTSANLDRYLGFVGNNRGVTDPFLVELGGGRPDIEFGTVSRSSPQPVNTYDYITRVDWTPNVKDSFAFRYLSTDQIYTNQFPTVFEGFELDVPSLTQNFYMNYTRTISPRATNEFRFGYARTNVIFGARNEAALSAGPQISFGSNPISSFGFPAGFPQGRIFNNYQLQDTVTYTIGNHTIRAGGDIVFQRAKSLELINSRGTLTFTSGGGFSDFGNFVDAFSGTEGEFGSIQIGADVNYPNSSQQAYFVNDQWRMRENLTLNLGLRYENYGTPSNVLPFPAFAGFNVPFNTRAEQQRDNNNFAPRFSFAYTPRFARWLFGQERTVIRGGFAANYDLFFNNILSNTAVASPNVFSANTFGSTVGGRGFPNATAASLPTSGTLNPLSSVTTIVPDLRNPLTYVWNFGVQRELPFGMIVDAAYVGSRGTGLFINEELNPRINGARVHPDRGSILARTNGGDSIYHSLQARIERGFRNGLLFRFAYTFSKAIDTVNSEVFVTSGGSTRPTQQFDRRADRSVATFNVPHRAVLSFLYDIPSPTERGFLKQLFGGFSISGIYRIQSGEVETPYIGGFDINGDGSAFNDRPAVANPNAPANTVAFLGALFGVPSPTGYIDFNGNPVNLGDVRFVVDPGIRNGAIAGRNTLHGEKVNRLDLSLARSFRMPFTPMENDRLEIRAEFFNVTNTPNFSFQVPGTTGQVSDGNVFNEFFNDVRRNEGTSRSGRIQIRYVF